MIRRLESSERALRVGCQPTSSMDVTDSRRLEGSRSTALSYGLWAIHLIAGIAVIAWLLVDARFEASVEWWQFQQSQNAQSSIIRDMGDWWWLAMRNRAAAGILVVVVIANVLMLFGLWMGGSHRRTLRSWLVAISLVAFWVAIATGWQDLAWAGKEYRLRQVIAEFEGVFEDLNTRWPQGDGSRPLLGPFMAYPGYRPATLILLTLPEFERTDTTFSVIEGGDGALRFELVGVERGDWLEWHPAGSVPASFQSGLGDDYQLQKYCRLDRRWYLVRYQ